MVLSFQEEKELLELKEQFKNAERKHQLDFMREEHKCKMDRLSRMLTLVNAGWKGGYE